VYNISLFHIVVCGYAYNYVIHDSLERFLLVQYVCIKQIIQGNVVMLHYTV